MTWMIALTAGTLPPVIWSAHDGIHCTMPHVAIRAMEANEIARRVVFLSEPEKISRMGRAAPFFTEALQRSDSGTKMLMNKTKTAGAAPANITQRQEPVVTL